MELKKEAEVVLWVEEGSTALDELPDVPKSYAGQLTEPVIISIAAIPSITEQSQSQSILSSLATTDSSVNKRRTVKKACKHCNSMNIERRRRAGWEKIVLPLVKSYRYLCYTCGRDFFARRTP